MSQGRGRRAPSVVAPRAFAHGWGWLAAPVAEALVFIGVGLSVWPARHDGAGDRRAVDGLRVTDELADEGYTAEFRALNEGGGLAPRGERAAALEEIA